MFSVYNASIRLEKLIWTVVGGYFNVAPQERDILQALLVVLLSATWLNVSSTNELQAVFLNTSKLLFKGVLDT